MTLISKYVTAPYQGVSQAAPQVRLPEHAEILEDCMILIPQGSTKRPPFEWLGQLASHPGSTNGIFERIERGDAGAAFLTITKEGSAAVPRLWLFADFPSTGTPVAGQTVTTAGTAQTYLNTSLSSPVLDLAVCTVEDSTFIANRNVVVAKQSGVAATRVPEAMVWVRQAAYARVFTVTVTPAGGTPVTATLKTPNGTSTTDGDWVDTTVIAASLISGSFTAVNGATISGNLAALSSQGFTVTRDGAVISLVRNTGGDFTVAVSDGLGGTAMTAIKGSVQAFSDLPKRAINGFVARVTQNGGSNADDYYVAYVQPDGSGTGTWQETIASGAELGLDPLKMPVALAQPSGWTVTVQPWKARDIGNQELAPDPDFVGQAISDVSFWRDRLVIVAGEGVSLSSSVDPFRFYPRSLSTILPTDATTRLSPVPGRTTFKFAVGFDTKLIAFGNKCQASLNSRDEVATPNNTKLDVLTTYEFAANARPQNSNGKVYFLAPRGRRYSTEYELAVDQVTSTTDGEDMTVAIPRYVPAGVDRVANCPVNYLVAYGVSGSNAIFLHLFRYSERTRVQNAWCKWFLPEGYTLGGMFFDNTTLYILACKGAAAHLLACDTSPDLLDEDSERMLTCLDMRATEDQVGISYSASLDRTTLTLPWTATVNTRVSVRAPGGTGGPSLGVDGPGELPEGFLGTVLSYGGTSLVLAGDWRTVPFYVGMAYSSRHRISKIYPKAPDGNPIRGGRTSIRKLKVDLDETFYLRAEVTARGRDLRVYEYEGLRLDDPASQTDEAPSGSGVFYVPVHTENEQMQVEFINDSHGRHKLLGFEWTADLNPKSTNV